MLLKRPLKKVNSFLHEVLIDAVPNDGDFIEMGVYNGFSFGMIYKKAIEQNRIIHAIDTFTGMPESPIESDNVRFPPGMHPGNLERFKGIFPHAKIHQGLIPDILESIEIEKIAFAHLDTDHEFSTYPALVWTWDRLIDKGIVIIHDYNKTENRWATKAVNDWMREFDVDYIGICDNTIFFRKGVS